MKCVLHIGCEKTGTTSIQKFAMDNRQLLLSKSIQLLNTPGCPNATSLALVCMDYSRKDHNTSRLGINEDLAKRSKWCSDKSAQIVEELVSIKDSSSTVLISAEYLSSRLHTQEEVMRVKDILEKGGVEETIVVVYLRRQLEFSISRQSTAIKSALAHSGAVDLDDIFDLNPNNRLYNYESLLERWETVFGKDNLRVKIYDEKELFMGDVNLDFYAQVCDLTFEKTEIEKPVRVNRSLSALAQTCLAQLNMHLDRSGANQKSISRTMKVAGSYLDEFCSGEPFLPDRAKSIDFQEKFLESNRRVAQRWLFRENLFSEDFNRYPDIAQSISADDPRLFSLMMDMFAHLASYESSSTNEVGK